MTMAEFESPGDGTATTSIPSTSSMPTGTVTFLFTDIAGSTRLWERHPEAMRPALARHDALLRDAIEAHGGTVFKTVGDAFCAAFQTAPAAIRAALALQRALAAEPWPAEVPIRVRAGLHTGTADAEGGDYFGPALNRVARLMSAGHGEQTLLSASTWELVRDELPDDVGLRDLGERRLKDLRRPERVYQLIAPDLPADFPPLATLDARPHNLPVQLTSFVGREREMGEVKRLLGTSHLVTLTGVGGTGKTRLALQAAADLIDDFEHGVWFVDLAPLADASLVASTVATAVGVREEPERPIEATLADRLKSKRLLIVLDNCEHVVAACADVADRILRAAPGVRILATTREPLMIAGEATLAVPPLSVPDPVDAVAGGRQGVGVAAALAQYEAVRLFIDRAVAVQSNFAVTNANAPAVAGICQRLDGIPLAIELAAARARLLTPDDILSRLDDRFRLLTGGGRMALPRQQTLQAAIDWSYDLLPDVERRALARLSVFAGWVPLALAEATVAGEGVDAFEALDAIDGLIQKSLALPESRGEQTGVRLLETIRTYAAGKLAAAGDEWATRERQLDWYVAALVGAGFVRHGPEAAQLIARFDPQRDDFCNLVAWYLRHPSVTPALVSLGIAWFWFPPGRTVREAYDLLQHVAASLEASATPPNPWLMHALGENCILTGRYEVGSDCNARALADFRAKGEIRGQAWCLQALGRACLGNDKMLEAIGWFEASVAQRRLLGDPTDLSVGLEWLGEALLGIGKTERAAVLFRESLEILLPEDRPSFGQWPLLQLAVLGLRTGDVPEAARLVTEALGYMQHRSNGAFAISRDTAGGIGQAACVAAAMGRPDRSARLFGAADALLESDGSVLVGVERGDWDRYAADTRAGLGSAAWDAAYDAGRAMSLEAAVTYALETFVTTTQ